MNPYRAPETVSMGADDDIACAMPPVIARLAGGALALAGAVVALTGMQTLMMVTVRGPLAAAPYVLAGLGVPHLLLGAMVFRARAWAALLGMGGSGLLTLSSGAWLVFTVGHGLFSLYALAAPFVSIAALVVVLVGLEPCQRASAARARLRAQGLDLGI
jgi:hypothetical protein